jgi:hypothetical protein
MTEQRDRLETHSTSELISRLLTQFGHLWLKELSLAYDEMSGKLHGVMLATVSGAAALAFAVVGLVAAVITAIALLRLIVPLWAAALIITVLVFGCAALLALAAKSFIARASPLLPERTLNLLREDLKWAKTRRSSNGK